MKVCDGYYLYYEYITKNNLFKKESDMYCCSKLVLRNNFSTIFEIKMDNDYMAALYDGLICLYDNTLPFKLNIAPSNSYNKFIIEGKYNPGGYIEGKEFIISITEISINNINSNYTFYFDLDKLGELMNAIYRKENKIENKIYELFFGV